MLYNTVLFLLETAKEDKWYTKLFKSIIEQIKEFAGEFADFFSFIKRNTFDKLVEKFGATGVLLVFFAALIIIGMVVITGVIRGKD